MNTDFKSLEKRYGTLLAMKICEEITRAEQHRFSYYRANIALKSMQRFVDDESGQPNIAKERVA